MHHVRTQAPYAVLVGFTSIITGDLLSGYAYPMWVGLLVTVACVLALGWLLSARPDGDREDFVNMALTKVNSLVCKMMGKVMHRRDSPSDVSEDAVTVENPTYGFVDAASLNEQRSGK
jgi:hypothetical protein